MYRSKCTFLKLVTFNVKIGKLMSTTGCSLNIVFFQKILEYSELWSFSVYPRCQCVYTHQAGRTPALQQDWQSSEKSQHFKEKNTIINTLYLNIIVSCYSFFFFLFFVCFSFFTLFDSSVQRDKT